MKENIGLLLFTKFQLVDDHLIIKFSETEFENISKSQSMIFACLGNDDITISGIAKKLGVSRQAAQKTVSELVNRKLLTLRKSQYNKSAKTVALTRKGEKYVSHALLTFDQIERRITETIGTEKMKKLRELLELNWGL